MIRVKAEILEVGSIFIGERTVVVSGWHFDFELCKLGSIEIIDEGELERGLLIGGYTIEELKAIQIDHYGSS